MSENAALSEEDLILLDTLIYSDELFRNNKKDSTIGAILSDKAAEVKAQKPAMVIGADSWASAVDAAAAPGSAVGSLTVSDHFFNKNTGAEMVCLVDPSGQAYAIFRGTGKKEWSTDLEGVTSAGTFAQLEAWKWFSELPYENIIVSGHSNGGNKAMYVTMMAAHFGRADMVASCLALDAQGFSLRFMQEFLGAVKASGWKIHSLGNANDFIGPLLHSPALARRYVSGGSQTNIPHAIDALFHFDDGALRLNPGAAQSKAMEFLNGLSVFMSEVQGLDNLEVCMMAAALGQALNVFIGGEEDGEKDILAAFKGIVGIGLLLRNSSLYIAHLLATDYSAYLNYRHSMLSYLQALFGSAALARDFWAMLEHGRAQAEGAIGECAQALAAYRERDFTAEAVDSAFADMRRIKDVCGEWRAGRGQRLHRGARIPEAVMEEAFRWASMGEARLEAAQGDVCSTDESYGQRAEEAADRAAGLAQSLTELAQAIG